MPEELSDYINGIEKLTWDALTLNVQHHVNHEDNGNHNYLNKTSLKAYLRKVIILLKKKLPLML